MLKNQIEDLDKKEAIMIDEIKEIEEMLKKAKSDLTLLRRAKRTLIRMEEKINEPSLSD